MEKKTFQAKNANEVKVGRCLAVKKVYTTDTALYFTNKEGYAICLSNCGRLGWRLQANATGYEAICNHGAAQALAKYMGETLEDQALPIRVTEADGALVVTAADGSTATLALSKSFSLKFATKEGKTVTHLTGIYESGNTVKKITVKGALTPDEAIYGGGERFDTVNKRGTDMELYTCDGWNNSGTTYVVQPLFLTTEGGGMFFNRYESATVDFGKANAEEWVYFLRAKDLDCYFYPTGSMDGALAACTELLGHALMPTPWMQGMQICRYSRDFRRFEAELKFDDLTSVSNYDRLFVKSGDDYVLLSSLDDAEKAKARRFFTFDEANNKYVLAYLKDDAGRYCPPGPKNNPGGDSCKTIMESHINMGAKPDAASMEARGWMDCFCDTDESRENKADLQRSFDWLHENGMRAMVYIRVGGINRRMIGFKEEYLVHADVEVQNEDGTVTVRENTTQIPWIMGTGDNPDVGRRSGEIRTVDHLDITNPEAIDWYFKQIWGEMIEMGIDGVKIDFCEVMPDGEKQVGITKTHYKWKNPELLPAGIVHHAYPAFFISAFTKLMTELKETKGKTDGFMVFSRGGGIGSQRSPYLWAGDQGRAFEKLDDQLMAVVNCGLSAIPYMSFDMAGYAYAGTNYFDININKESEIFARGTEFTAFMTNMQTHGDVRHAYEMTAEVQDIYRNYLKLHSKLIPYMQKLSRIACDTGMAPVRHPVLEYPADKNVYSINDQFLLGDALLVAPILTEHTFEREVYLPAGAWIDLLTGESVEGGKTVTVKASLAQIPVFLNTKSADAASIAPIFDGEEWTAIKNA